MIREEPAGAARLRKEVLDAEDAYDILGLSDIKEEIAVSMEATKIGKAWPNATDFIKK